MSLIVPNARKTSVKASLNHLWGMTSLLPVDHPSTGVSRPTTTHLVRSQIQVILRLGQWAVFSRWSKRGTMQIWDLPMETEASLLPLLSAHLPSLSTPRQRWVSLRARAAVLVLKTFTATARSVPAPTKCRGSAKKVTLPVRQLFSTPPCQREPMASKLWGSMATTGLDLGSTSAASFRNSAI